MHRARRLSKGRADAEALRAGTKFRLGPILTWSIANESLSAPRSIFPLDCYQSDHRKAGSRSVCRLVSSWVACLLRVRIRCGKTHPPTPLMRVVGRVSLKCARPLLWKARALLPPRRKSSEALVVQNIVCDLQKSVVKSAAGIRYRRRGVSMRGVSIAGSTSRYGRASHVLYHLSLDWSPLQ